MDLSITTGFLVKLLNHFDFSAAGEALEKYLHFLPIFILGAIATLILTPIVGKIALKYDITYKPGVKRKGRDFDNQQKALHEGVTPALGGLAITIPVFIAILLFFKIDSFTLPILVALLILMVGSALDDIFNLSARTQFIYQLLAAGIIAFSVINLTNLSIFNIQLDAYTWNFSLFGIQQSLVLPGDIFLILWLVACINAFKWTAGSPGIIESNSLVIFLLIFVIGIRFSSIFSTTISMLIAGGLSLFLVFALPPQKIMTGSAGKSVYGFLICVLSIITDTKLSTTIILLALPIIDFAYVIIKRYIVHKPKSFKELLKINGPDHFHHQLIKLGLNRMQIVLVEMTITLLLGSFAILTTGAFTYFSLVFVIAISIGTIVFINIKASKKQEKEEKEESPESKYSY